jgi:hypothetical protein
MGSSTSGLPTVQSVSISDDSPTVERTDGRTLSVPLVVSSTLSRHDHGTQSLAFDRRWHGILWRELDEDVSVDGLLRGRTSAESQRSLKQWLESRTAV